MHGSQHRYYIPLPDSTSLEGNIVSIYAHSSLLDLPTRPIIGSTPIRVRMSAIMKPTLRCTYRHSPSGMRLADGVEGPLAVRSLQYRQPSLVEGLPETRCDRVYCTSCS